MADLNDPDKPKQVRFTDFSCGSLTRSYSVQRVWRACVACRKKKVRSHTLLGGHVELNRRADQV